MLRTLAIATLLAVPALVAASDKKAFIGVQIATNEDKVLLLTAVFKDSPADKAGLKARDVLLKINDVKPVDLQTAVKVIQSLKPGKKVKFLIERDGKSKEIEVTPKGLDD